MTPQQSKSADGALITGFRLCESACGDDCNCLDKVQCADEIERQMKAHQAHQLAICAELEDIADRLPEGADAQHMLIMSRNLYSIVKTAHDFEEKRVFPLLKALSVDDEALGQSLERLKFEHWEDESFAEELSEALRRQVMQGDARHSETLAYMLRGFFEGIRRHIAFELEHIMPLMKQATGSPQ